MKVIALVLSAVCASTDAFVVHTTAAPSRIMTTTSLNDRQRLNDIDLMAIENVAELCLNVESMVDECDLDEHEALVNQLTEQRDIIQEQKDILDDHAKYLDEILGRLAGHEVEGHSLNEDEIVYDQ